MRRLLIVAALLLAAPASASAALEQVPPTTISGPRSECVQSTGPTGEVLAATRTRLQLLRPTREGFKAEATPDFDTPPVPDCGSASISASGSGVIACCNFREGPAAAVREPGGAWSEPSELAEEGYAGVIALATAVSERGDALVMYSAESFSRDDRGAVRLYAVRRSPGGGFGEPESLGGPYGDDVRGLQAGLTAEGEAIVLWETPDDFDAVPRRNTVDLMVATAPAGGRFGAPVKLATMPRLSHASLAVAPDGHALVALADATTVRVAERAPGGAFGASVPVVAHKDPVGASTRAALDGAGRAAIAWTGVAFGGVGAVTRAAPGAFSAPVSLAPAVRRLPYDAFLLQDGGLTYDIPAGGWWFGGAEIQTGLDPSGAWVTWDQPQAARGPFHDLAAVATLPFDGSPALTQTAGTPTASAGEPRRVALPDGTPGLMWLDFPDDDHIRLRLATEGAPVSPAPPELRVGRPLKTALGVNDKLRLPVRCGGPCEIRAELVGASWADTLLQLPRGGSGTLVLDSYAEPIAPRRPGRVRVRLVYAALDGARTATRTVSLRLSQRRAAPIAWPHLHDLRAVRRGKRIEVSWTADKPTESNFQVTGSTTRSRFELPVAVTLLYDRARRRAFSVTLPAAEVRYVTLYSFGPRPYKTVVRVR
ncbi:hypothetical protein [Solirubrobacter soli]|uniref:hypothetical protein n=1 Tax=Solirubrobacter soli TaxID=363832 RepID=UPI000413E658|nr:hypothetical protein [Solirubrobacter soli]